MAKKHWIYIKRGLSEDAKHRAQMGECIWLYMHIIDRADWEMGIAYDWKDKEEAADMSMNFETLRDQRQKLERLDYIRCDLKQRGQDIKIMEWRNPRDYGSEVKNPRILGDALPLPTEIQGYPHSYPQSDPQVSSQPVTPTSNSKDSKTSESLKNPKPDILDGILEYQLHPKAIQDAIKKYFKLTPNWEAKYNTQFMEWAVETGITPEQVQKAAELWRIDKRFNWAVPSLRGIQEHWLELITPTSVFSREEPKAFEAIRQFMKTQEALNGNITDSN